MDCTSTDVLPGLRVAITGVYAALTYGSLVATRRSVEPATASAATEIRSPILANGELT